MSLITCPECGRPGVSDKAPTCPGCGYPLNTPTSTKPRVRNGKPLKMPNGDGCIYRLSGKRRKPYAVRKTAGWIIDPDTGKSKQTFINLGTFATRTEAMQALAAFNADPYDIKANSITFAEVYEKWSQAYFPTLSSPSSVRTITAAYAYCNGLYDMRMRDIRVSHLEGTILNSTAGNSTKERIKSLFNAMYRYALSHEICDKDYASLMFANGNPIKREIAKEIIPFSQEEILILWDNLDVIPFIDMVIIGIYSGWRPQELATLKIADIDFDTNTMRGGLKTDAGKNRLVPIHPLIKPLIEKRMAEAHTLKSEYLFNDANGQRGTHINYDKYNQRFKKAMTWLKMQHRPHETRHTFITKAKACHMDEHILKLIVGHVEKDITERIYTHRTLEQLQEEIKKVTK